MITVKDFWRLTGEYMQPCPVCSPHRKKKKAKCFGVKREDNYIIYNCFHCGEHGKIQVGGDYETSRVCEGKKIRTRVVVRQGRKRVLPRQRNMDRNTIPPRG